MGTTFPVAFHLRQYFILKLMHLFFKAHLISYILMIYLHTDLKACFIIHAIINQTKKNFIKHPQDALSLNDLSLKQCHVANLS